MTSASSADSATWRTARSVPRNPASRAASRSAVRLVLRIWWRLRPTLVRLLVDGHRLSSWDSSVSSSPPAICRVSSSRVDLVALLVQHRLAQLQDDEVVADQVGVVRVVGDEDDAEAGVARRRGVLQHHAGLLDAERRRRLVEDQHPGAEVDRTGDRDTLALTAGELADGLVDVLDHDAHLAQLLVGDALHVLDLQPGERDTCWRSSRSRGRSSARPPSGSTTARSW